MKTTFKVDITKIDKISDKSVQRATGDELFDLINSNEMYFIDAKGFLMFVSDGGFFESLRYDVTEYFYSTHTEEDRDFFIGEYPNLLSIMEIVDLDEEVEKRKNKTTRSEVAIERYNSFKLDEDDLMAIKDLSESENFGFHSIMETFDIDYETFRMIEEDNSVTRN